MDTRQLNLEALEEPYAALRAVHPRSEARLLLSMQALGQKTPVIVIPTEVSGAYAVVDGHKRLRVLRRLKADVAGAEVWPLPAGEALARAYRMHQGVWNVLEEGALIEELHRRARWSLRKIAEELDRTEGWVSRRLGLMEGLSPSVRQAVQQGRLGVYSAVTYLLPLTRVKPQLAERLAEKLKEGAYTTRQVRLLYGHCLKGPAAVAERIASDPATFLKALEVPKGDVRLAPEQNKCLERLNLIGKIALGLVRDVAEVWPSPTDEPAHCFFVKAWRTCRERLGYLEKTVALQEGLPTGQAGLPAQKAALSGEALHA